MNNPVFLSRKVWGKIDSGQEEICRLTDAGIGMFIYTASHFHSRAVNRSPSEDLFLGNMQNATGRGIRHKSRPKTHNNSVLGKFCQRIARNSEKYFPRNIGYIKVEENK